MNYTHLTREERYQIYALKKAGNSQNEIANVLERNPSTISRELSRNHSQRGYRPKQAHRLVCECHATKAWRIDEATWRFAQAKLREDWSPDQISNHATISHETVYQRVYADKRAGGSLWKYLRCQKQRRKRYGKHDRRGAIPNRIGDWKADTVIGKNHKQAIVSLVERKSGFTLIRKVECRTADAVSKAMTKLLKPYQRRVHTITSDNGKGFVCHEEVARALRADLYFAHAYASWERGTNENTNGLIRQYFPKGMDFTTITQQEINYAMKQLNNRPRKRLGYLTPAQVFFKSGVAPQE